MLGLKVPVPRPIMMRPRMKTPSEVLGLARTEGADEATRMRWPISATMTEMTMVL